MRTDGRDPRGATQKGPFMGITRDRSHSVCCFIDFFALERLTSGAERATSISFIILYLTYLCLACKTSRLYILSGRIQP